MNVKDVASPQLEGDKLALIFARQRELMEKYHSIEKANGLLLTEDVPVNLHDPKGQARLKDFAWRFTEELAEAMDALSHHSEEAHVQEELADAFHFLVEFTILGGSHSNIIPLPVDFKGDRLENIFERATMDTMDGEIPETIDQLFTQVVTGIGMVCHTLKNKPWKQTQMLTDEYLFVHRTAKVFLHFARLCVKMGLDAQGLFDLYYRKSEINRFRQRSNY